MRVPKYSGSGYIRAQIFWNLASPEKVAFLNFDSYMNVLKFKDSVFFIVVYL